MIMKIKSKLIVDNRSILSLDGEVLALNAKKVIIQGKKYSFEIAYDMKNTIGINGIIDDCNEVEFLECE